RTHSSMHSRRLGGLLPPCSRMTSLARPGRGSSPRSKGLGSDMAVNTTTEHALQVCDDSGISSVAVCVCGRSWIGVGDERCRMARCEHTLHLFEAGEALVGNSGRLRVEPVWGEIPDCPTPARGRPSGGGVSAEDRKREVVALMADGLSQAE